MANKPLKSVKFPGLGDTYTIHQVDTTLAVTGAAADSKKVGDEITELKNDFTDMDGKIDASLITNTASGSIASFPDGADGVPVKDLTVQIVPVQSGSGDPAPDNVRPISGWTGANVVRTGKNLYDATTYPLKEGWYINRNTGAPAQNASYDCTESFIPIGGLYGQTIKWNCPDHGGSNPGLVFYDKDKHYISGARIFPAVVPTNAEYLRFTVAHGQTDIMLYIGDTPSTYEPYQGNTYSITFPTEAGTVYGGTLDVTSGVLTVDRASVIIEASEISSVNMDGDNARVTISSDKLLGLSNYKSGMCNKAKFLTSWASVSADSNGIAINSKGSKQFVINKALASSKAEVQELCGSDGIQLVTSLATPQTYQLTPTEVSTLLGQNNIWADCGDVSVDYRADTKLYIENLTAPSEDDMVANTNIPDATYFMVGNTLYLSTTTIPAGDTINPGTNCTLMNLAAALNAINA